MSHGGPSAFLIVPLLVLLAGALAPPAMAGPPPERLSTDVVPTHQAVELTLDPDRTTYDGRVIVDLTVRQATSEIRFHARALTIDAVSLRGPAGEIAVSPVERLEPDQVRLRLAAPLAPGDYSLAMEFHNNFNTRAISLYRVETGGNGYLFTQFEDTEAREAFPCWDEPEFKIPWTIRLTVPSGDQALSNAPIAHEIQTDTMRRVEFAKTKPLSSYLVALAVGPFETVPITSLPVPGRIVTVKGASGMAGEAVAATPPLVQALERYFGRPYPYEKLDLVAAPEFMYGAMENAGAIVFADKRLLIDPRAVDPDQRRRMVSVVAHELAHMWFGDLVTMKWWDDLWLNESFANWMGTKVMDEIFPELKQGVSDHLGLERAFATDSRPSTRAMRAKVGALSLAETANELTYNKGQAVLTMFEGWLGADTFRKGVLEYLKKYEWKNAEGRDLWNALGEVSGEDIDGAMASFLELPGVPLVTVEPLDGGRVRLTQRRFLTVGETSDAPLWRIPVILGYPAPGGIQTKRVWLTGPETVTDLGTGRTPGWIEPNAGASGYYRWSVPDAMLDSLVAAAPSLGEVERIDLVGNLGALLRAGRLGGDRYLAFMSRLADDPSLEVVRAVLTALNDVRAPLGGTGTETGAAFARYLRRAFEPALSRIGLKPSPGEPVSVTLVRPLLLHFLAGAGQDTALIEYAESLWRDNRNDPTSVPASLVDFSVLIGARRGDRVQFEDYRRRFETTIVPVERTLYLAGLGSFGDPALQKEALDYALKGSLRPQEILIIPGSMGTDALSAESRSAIYPDEVTDWLMNNYAALAGMMPENFSARLLPFIGGCSRDRVDTLETFMAGPGGKMLGGEARARRLADTIEECAALNEREGARAAAWLAGSP